MYQWGRLVRGRLCTTEWGRLVRGRLCTSGGGRLEEDCVPVGEVG